jgi:hypothetical protein
MFACIQQSTDEKQDISEKVQYIMNEPMYSEQCTLQDRILEK